MAISATFSSAQAAPQAILSELDAQALYSMPASELDAIQFEGVRAAFIRFKDILPALSRLAADSGVTHIDEINDIVPLLFPHTFYKSYPSSLIEKGQFDRMTKWLQTLTTADLSKVDGKRCDSIDSWLAELDSAAQMVPACSSGTGGKISFTPFTRAEQTLIVLSAARAYEPFGDEHGLYLYRDGSDITLFTSTPAVGPTGQMRLKAAIAREALEDKLIDPGTAASADMLWLIGRLRLAEANGELERLRLTPALERLRDAAPAVATGPDAFHPLWNRLLTEMSGKRIVSSMPWIRFYELAKYAQAKGVPIDISPGSFLYAGGGSKGLSLPDDLFEVVNAAFPVKINELYGMSEMSGIARKCGHGHYHQSPWVVQFLLDPVSGEPLPRTGTVTGRFALYDLWAQSHWGGFITGDELTINWDGGCPCGRTGAYISGSPTRFSEKPGSDDKITCAKTPDAYDKAVGFLQNQ